ncbi:MAG TPA: DnaJ domain-containing protein [Candidatus Dormibacteraeota bacterium]|nr:DnaJ domain-containing protein [Candidatus Dormibacteraeota bacterium]
MSFEAQTSGTEIPKEPFDYEPIEGIDYLVDLYSLSGVERDSSSEDIKLAINKRLLEYHPDRLQGLAPEFNETGERTVLLLNRARHILLDETRRTEYDGLLSLWTGPISEKGIPAITVKRWETMKRSLMTSEEVESDIAKTRLQIEALTGYRPGRIERMESLAEKMGDEPDPDITLELEEALFQYDRVLSIEQAERLQLFDIETKGNDYRVSIESPRLVAEQLEVAKQTIVDDQIQTNSSNIASRLAILSGENISAEAQILPMGTNSTPDLPRYFDDQSKKIIEIADLRGEILKKRLDILEPTYPFPELQTEIQPKIILGVVLPDQLIWLAFTHEYDQDTDNLRVETFGRDEHLTVLLDSKAYEEILRSGFNLAMIKLPENIDVMTVVNHALGKVFTRFKSS